MNELTGRSLDQWVDYIQTLHHREIELSLERVRAVYQRMYPKGLACKIISISGTNGKGSTAELLNSIYHAAGYRVGKFTSPHLVSFNERIEIDRSPIDDTTLLHAFERVERFREDTPITFFEFGALLAIDAFAQAKVDVAIMEVGLGGRLDAVNILDPDIAVLTSISIDHTAWLGNSIDEIAFEKAGIARAHKPFIVGLSKLPASLTLHCDNLQVDIQQITKDFDHQYSDGAATWSWNNSQREYTDLPLPYAQAGVQLANCSLALQAVLNLEQDLPFDEKVLYQGIESARILGRCQILQSAPLVILDVSHNESSLSRLDTFIESRFRPEEKVVAVCGMLTDKEIKASLEKISPRVSSWHAASINNPRGASASEIAAEIQAISDAPVDEYDCVERAYDAAMATLTENDCLVVFGSFHIVGDILAHLD